MFRGRNLRGDAFEDGIWVGFLLLLRVQQVLALLVNPQPEVFLFAVFGTDHKKWFNFKLVL